MDAVADAFRQIGVDPGTSTAAALNDKRYVGKLDWNISDNHRASFTFQRTEESKPQPYSSYARDYSVIMPSNWYSASSKTDNYSVQLFSDWSENFSTELKIGYQKFGAVNGAAFSILRSTLPETMRGSEPIGSKCAGIM